MTRPDKMFANLGNQARDVCHGICYVSPCACSAAWRSADVRDRKWIATCRTRADTSADTRHSWGHCRLEDTRCRPNNRPPCRADRPRLTRCRPPVSRRPRPAGPSTSRCSASLFSRGLHVLYTCYSTITHIIIPEFK